MKQDKRFRVESQLVVLREREAKNLFIIYENSDLKRDQKIEKETSNEKNIYQREVEEVLQLSFSAPNEKWIII